MDCVEYMSGRKALRKVERTGAFIECILSHDEEELRAYSKEELDLMMDFKQ